MHRRNFIQNSSMATVGLGLGAPLKEKNTTSEKRKGNVRHSASHWCFADISFEKLLPAFKEIGLEGIDLIGPNDWATLKKYDIDCSMCNGAELSLTEGWCDPDYHEQLIKNYTELIPKVADAGYKNLICFSGNRRSLSDQEGLVNCVQGLSQILPLAEKAGVVIQMELFNSKIDHPDYMCDKSHWGVQLCRLLDTDQFKLLYDIYHMQINEGDVIRTIQAFHPYFGHYHTAGVPGRNEINNTQELNYPAIIKAIVQTGFKGYVAQEFVPTYPNKLDSLKEAINICDV